ncbi:MAG: cytochrome d ubiquinol oxidase subunit II [Paracoccaceae bacterium]|nr:cytochrome d ubiquinol oxidase subunit II [Paracoccaceae bacterium]
MTLFGDPEVWLPLAFAGLMGFSILVYVVLDGFDLGVGLLAPLVDDAERDRMVASIGPFWDANETWLVLAIGLLLVAFPEAHGMILSGLYLPVAIMLIGLILRGVAFEFRVKAPAGQKANWDRAFFAGSLMTSLSQGFMLGMYITGLEWTLATLLFSTITAVFLTVGYSFIGATWLIYKTDDDLQRKAVDWARGGIWGLLGGVAAISIASPLASERIFERWFGFPEILLLAPLPLTFAAIAGVLVYMLRKLPAEGDAFAIVPFAATVLLFALAFAGLAYSFYPFVVPDRLTLYEAAAAPESLLIILVGAVVVIPIIIAYSALAYTVFRGKATDLTYY